MHLKRISLGLAVWRLESFSVPLSVVSQTPASLFRALILVTNSSPKLGHFKGFFGCLNSEKQDRQRVLGC
jgi:hypothetical protein